MTYRYVNARPKVVRVLYLSDHNTPAPEAKRGFAHRTECARRQRCRSNDAESAARRQASRGASAAFGCQPAFRPERRCAMNERSTAFILDW